MQPRDGDEYWSGEGLEPDDYAFDDDASLQSEEPAAERISEEPAAERISEEPAAERIEDRVTEAGEWPPRPDDDTGFHDPSQWSLAEDYRGAPAPPERATAAPPELLGEAGQRRRPILAGVGYQASNDWSARHGAATDAAAADHDGNGWTAAGSEWPDSDAVAGPNGEQGATAEGDPWRRPTRDRVAAEARAAAEAPSDPAVEGFEATANGRSGAPQLEAADPDLEASWTESGLSHRLREAIASVRRISVGGRPAANVRPREEFGLEEALEQPGLWRRFRKPAASAAPDDLGSWEAPERPLPSATPGDLGPWGQPAASAAPDDVGSWEDPERPAASEARDDVAPWEPPEQPVPSEAPEDLGPWEAPEQPAGAAAPEDFVPWRPSDRRAPIPGAPEGGRGLRVTALVVASAVVLLVGSGLGALLAGWHLELPTRAAAVDSAAPPAASPSPPPITDVVRLQPPPTPPTPEDAPLAADNAMPLPPPPKPSPWSSAAAQGASQPGLIGEAIDALLRETARSDGASGTPEAGGPRVLVHYTASAASGPATALHLVRQLKAAGFAVEARQVDSPIAAPSVRYFFAADRDEAEALGSSLEGQWPGGAAPPVLDFTDFQPKPPPGNLEVWVGS